MRRFARLLPALAGWIPAAAYAHPGSHPHAHPHLDLYVIVLVLVAVAAIGWGVARLASRARNKRRPGE